MTAALLKQAREALEECKGALSHGFDERTGQPVFKSVAAMLAHISASNAAAALTAFDSLSEYDRAVSALATTGVIKDGFIGHGEAGTFGHFSRRPDVGPDGYWTWRLATGMNHKPLPFLSAMAKCEDWRASLRRIVSGSALPVEAP